MKGENTDALSGPPWLPQPSPPPHPTTLPGSPCAHSQIPRVSHHQVWGEQGMGHPGNALQGELEGAVEHAEIVEDGGAVPWADVLLPAEGRDGDGVGPEGAGLHAGEAPVDVPLWGRGCP